MARGRGRRRVMRRRKVYNVASCFQNSSGEAVFPKNWGNVHHNKLPSVDGEGGVGESDRDGHYLLGNRFWGPIDCEMTSMRELLRNSSKVVSSRVNLDVPGFLRVVLVHETHWRVVLEKMFQMVVVKELRELFNSVEGDINSPAYLQNINQGGGGDEGAGLRAHRGLVGKSGGEGVGVMGPGVRTGGEGVVVVEVRARQGAVVFSVRALVEEAHGAQGERYGLE